MTTHNICFYKEEDKSTQTNLKITKLRTSAYGEVYTLTQADCGIPFAYLIRKMFVCRRANRFCVNSTVIV